MYITIPKESKDQMISKIQEYFYNERSEEIGDLGAQLLLDYMIEELGPYLYNQGIKDVKALVEQRMISMEEDISSLERPVNLNKYRD